MGAKILYDNDRDMKNISRMNSLTRKQCIVFS